MDQLKLVAIFVLLLHKTSSDQVSEESKKIVLKPKAKVFNGKNFQCDLTLLPQQKKLMYFGARSADESYDLFRWPKNKNGQVVVPYLISKTSHFCK